MIKQALKNKVLKGVAGVFSAFFLVSVVLHNVGGWLKDYEEQSVVAEADAWGAEAISGVGETLQAMAPIPLANACGLGASSCFRCHNDRRAAAPSKGEDAPWHVDHDKVNYSCAGCHNGNPRILKKEIAHQNLIANSVAQPQATCASCHGADSDAKVKVYLDKHPHLSK